MQFDYEDDLGEVRSVGWMMAGPELPRNLENPKEVFNFVKLREATKRTLNLTR